jgi:hypothetical protein
VARRDGETTRTEQPALKECMAEAGGESHVSELAALDLTDAELYRNGFPHEVFTTLRRAAPVWWQAVPAGVTECADDGFWVLSKYHDIQAANRDSERFSALDGPSLVDRPELCGTMLVSMDGREHTRQRTLISAGFTPRMVERLVEQMRRWAVTIVDEALARGTCDFVQDIAYQLPMRAPRDHDPLRGAARPHPSDRGARSPHLQRAEHLQPDSRGTQGAPGASLVGGGKRGISTCENEHTSTPMAAQDRRSSPHNAPRELPPRTGAG